MRVGPTWVAVSDTKHRYPTIEVGAATTIVIEAILALRVLFEARRVEATRVIGKIGETIAVVVEFVRARGASVPPQAPDQPVLLGRDVEFPSLVYAESQIGSRFGQP
jgi:hypothetical protein